MTETGNLLTLKEAAALTGYKADTLRKRVKSGELHGSRDNLGRWVVSLAAVEDLRRPNGSAEQKSEQQEATESALIEQLRGEVTWLRSHAERLEDELIEARAETKAVQAELVAELRRPWWRKLAG